MKAHINSFFTKVKQKYVLFHHVLFSDKVSYTINTDKITCLLKTLGVPPSHPQPDDL